MWKILGALLCSCALAIATECQITIPGDFTAKSPFILTQRPGEKDYELFRSTKTVTYFAEGSTLSLICSGSRDVEMKSLDEEKPFGPHDIQPDSIVFQRKNKGVTAQEPLTHIEKRLVLTCKDGQFVHNKIYRPLREIECSKIPSTYVRETTTPCSEDRGFIQEVSVYGYRTYYKIFEICHNEEKATTYYTHNTLSGETIEHKICCREETQSSFRADGMKYGTDKVNKLYKEANQKEVFKKLFVEIQETPLDVGQPTPAGQRKKKTNQAKPKSVQPLLNRGHMTRAADLKFGYEIQSTYLFSNVAPQYTSVNDGNWQKVENKAQQLAKDYGGDIESYTGCLGILELRDVTNDEMTEVYLHEYEDKQKKEKIKDFAVPKYYFKVLWQKSEESKKPKITKISAIVFVTINNTATITKDPKDIFCKKDICKEVGLSDPDFEKYQYGYTFCCSLNDFQTLYNVLPEDVKAENLLMNKTVADIKLNVENKIL